MHYHNTILLARKIQTRTRIKIPKINITNTLSNLYTTDTDNTNTSATNTNYTKQTQLCTNIELNHMSGSIETCTNGYTQCYGGAQAKEVRTLGQSSWE